MDCFLMCIIFAFWVGFNVLGLTVLRSSLRFLSSGWEFCHLGLKQNLRSQSMRGFFEPVLSCAKKHLSIKSTQIQAREGSRIR